MSSGDILTNVIPVEKLTVENTIFWNALVKFAVQNDFDDMESLICENVEFSEYMMT